MGSISSSDFSVSPSFNMAANMEIDTASCLSKAPASSSSSHSHTSMDNNYFCGVCFIDCGPGSGEEGCRWHSHGDWLEAEKKWVYLCSGCSKYLWRLFSKGEDVKDWDSSRKDFMLFLKYEIEKAQMMMNS